jgi:predicted nucleic acid-binding protein
MALVYLDTSALVKLFVQESGSPVVLDLARVGSGHTIALLELSRVELHSAIHRRERAGDVSPGTARRARDVLDRHLRSRFVVQRLTEPLLDRACNLVERYALRAYDSLQLAGAIECATGQETEDNFFVSADRSLGAAAASEGLKAIDPSESEGRS